MSAVHITINLISYIYILYYYTFYIVKTTPSLFKGLFLDEKKAAKCAAGVRGLRFPYVRTERNLKLRKIAGKARAARSRCACGAYLYIYRSWTLKWAISRGGCWVACVRSIHLCPIGTTHDFGGMYTYITYRNNWMLLLLERNVVPYEGNCSCSRIYDDCSVVSEEGM